MTNVEVFDGQIASTTEKCKNLLGRGRLNWFKYMYRRNVWGMFSVLPYTIIALLTITNMPLGDWIANNGLIVNFGISSAIGLLMTFGVSGIVRLFNRKKSSRFGLCPHFASIEYDLLTQREVYKSSDKKISKTNSAFAKLNEYEHCSNYSVNVRANVEKQLTALRSKLKIAKPKNKPTLNSLIELFEQYIKGLNKLEKYFELKCREIEIKEERKEVFQINSKESRKNLARTPNVDYNCSARTFGNEKDKIL